MQTELKFTIEGGDFEGAGMAASATKKVLKQLNIEKKIIKRTIVALYEGEVNIVAHTFRGEITVSISNHRIQVVLKDTGPGIADIEKAMSEGFSTASPMVRQMGFGAGMGLPNMKKNADHLTVESTADVGTKVTMIFEI